MTTIIGTLVKQSAKLSKTIQSDKKSLFEQQKRELNKLLNKAKNTVFGQHYHFEEIIKAFKNNPKSDRTFFKKYTETLPILDYETIYSQWWYRDREKEEKNICWRGKVKYYALSSGTSGSPSKHIPITRSMLRAIQRVNIRQLLALDNFKIPSQTFSKGLLALGGSTNLSRGAGYYEGDLSGITTSRVPFWFQQLYKPGRKIARQKDWEKKLEEITLNADKWDIGYVAGNPAWIQMMIEKIIAHYRVKNIHEVWPNLTAYAYGGVSFEPYKKAFEKLLGKPLIYVETYLASEGFIAFQSFPDRDMQMITDNGIFYEFIPFNEKNFDEDGELIGKPETLLIDEVEVGVNYALLISTCAGSWRYMIGDTIQFKNKERAEIIITGRTKQFLSLCGEHLSVDNMNKAIELVAEELNISVKEFTVTGIPYQGFFAHQWYIGTDDTVDNQILKEKIDEKLKLLNDDYSVERKAVLKDIFVKTIPTDMFYKWMESTGKIGGQSKFPRVLKKSKHEEWAGFLEKMNL